MRSPSNLYPIIALLLVVLKYYFLKGAKIVILSCFRPLSIAILVKNSNLRDFNSCVTDGRMDGQTDGHTLESKDWARSEQRIEQERSKNWEKNWSKNRSLGEQKREWQAWENASETPFHDREWEVATKIKLDVSKMQVKSEQWTQSKRHIAKRAKNQARSQQRIEKRIDQRINQEARKINESEKYGKREQKPVQQSKSLNMNRESSGKRVISNQEVIRKIKHKGSKESKHWSRDQQQGQ